MTSTTKPKSSSQPKPTQAVFSPMTEDDLLAVLAIEKRAYSHPWRAGIFSDCLRAGYAAELMHIRRELIGYAVVMQVLDEAHILNICVDPKLHGQGYGYALLKHLQQQAEAAQASQIYLEVRASNTRAIALYERFGFAEYGVRPNYYPAKQGSKEDALMMALQLSDHMPAFN